jgi:hypothetical protein
MLGQASDGEALPVVGHDGLLGAANNRAIVHIPRQGRHGSFCLVERREGGGLQSSTLRLFATT